ncbi:hypothetical protein TNCT_507881 [Trichonephila clavata]|uniref:Uncharacterized protein n=1 Tax=Trichonephila clavata TaxID=2740835 RepID=A0A8X6KVK9_TRICU|nr:hypothetical protein TNCT_507881 [Trichonephila clavata]
MRAITYSRHRPQESLRDNTLIPGSVKGHISKKLHVSSGGLSLPSFSSNAVSTLCLARSQPPPIPFFALPFQSQGPLFSHLRVPSNLSRRVKA